MRPTALLLLLIFALPSLGLAQTSPAYPQVEPVQVEQAPPVEAAADAPIVLELVPHDEFPATVVEVAPAPIYKRWYFWTGIGVVATGLIVSAVLFASAPHRQPTPTQVCNGSCDACIGFSCP